MIRSASSRARDDASLMVDDEILGEPWTEESGGSGAEGGETPPKRGRHVGHVRSVHVSPRPGPVLVGGPRRPTCAVRPGVRLVPRIEHAMPAACVSGYDSNTPDSNFPDSNRPESYFPDSRCAGDVPLESVPFIESLDALYVLGRTIGRGEFAKVKLATCRATGAPVAVKLVSTDTLRADDGAHERLLREVAIHRDLRHAHIVRVHAVLRTPGAVAIVMEWMDGGELFERVQRMGRLPEAEVRRTMAQVLCAVEHLHARGVVHLDLKLENVLCDAAGTRVALSDFGFARTFRAAADVLATSCGSPCYAAPELVLDRAGYRGPPADIWSCGVIFYAVAFGHLPFEADLDLERDAATGAIRWSPPNVYRLYRHIATHAVRLPRVAPVPVIDAAQFQNAPVGSAPVGSAQFESARFENTQSLNAQFENAEPNNAEPKSAQSNSAQPKSAQLKNTQSNNTQPKNEEPRGPPAKPPGLSLLGRDLLLRLLDPDPATRISMPEIWRHAWFLDAVQ